MSVSADLGSFSLVHGKCSIYFRVSTTITLSKSASNEPPEELLYYLKTSRPWVTSTRNFQLRISLSQNKDGCHIYLVHSDWRAVALTLARAELWSQLDFRASILELGCPSGKTSEQQIVIGLDHIAYERNSFPNPHHRLMISEGIADLKPPSGLPSHNLHVVTLVIYVEETPHSGYNEFKLEEAVALVDAALRCSICRKPAALPEDFNVVQDARDMTLSEVAPTLWTPGYFKGIAERACFLYIINSSFSHIRSIMSEQRLTKNCIPPPNVASQRNREPVVTDETQKFETVNHQLWLLLRQGELSKNVTRDLKAVELLSEIEDAEEEMLGNHGSIIATDERASDPKVSSHSSSPLILPSARSFGTRTSGSSEIFWHDDKLALSDDSRLNESSSSSSDIMKQIDNVPFGTTNSATSLGFIGIDNNSMEQWDSDEGSLSPLSEDLMSVCSDILMEGEDFCSQMTEPALSLNY